MKSAKPRVRDGFTNDTSSPRRRKPIRGEYRRKPALSDPLRFLILHEDAATLLALKRGIEGAGAFAFGGRSAQSAIDRIAAGECYDAILLPWSLGGQGGYELVWGLEHAGLRAPYLMAFSRAWQRDDAARALQLGYDAFFGSPVGAREVCNELLTLREGKVSPSRLKLIDMGGPEMLLADAKLWAVSEDPAWRSRMSALAARASTRFAQRTDRVKRVLDALDMAAARTVDASLADAVRRTCLGETVTEVARSAGYGPELLERLQLAARGTLSRGGADDAELLANVVERARERDRAAAASPAFQALCSRAADVLTGAPPGPFVSCLAEMLKLREAPVSALPPERLQEVAAQLVAAVHERDALAQARLVVMGDVLARGRAGGALQPSDMATLGALLECDDPYADGASALLVAAASHACDGTGLEAGGMLQLLGRTVDAVVARNPERRGEMRLLSERMADLAEASAPGGGVELRLVENALEAFQTGASDGPLSQATLAAVRGVLDAPPEQREASGRLLLAGMGVQAPDHAARLSRFLKSNRRALSMGELTEVAGAAATQAGLLQLRGELADRPESRTLDVREQATAKVFLGRAFEGLGMASDGAMTRDEMLRVLDGEPRALGALQIALSRVTDPAERRKAVARFVDATDDPTLLHAMLAAADDPELARAIRGRLGLPDGELGHPQVVELMRSGNMRGALVAVHALPQKHPRTVALLNQMALEFEHRGETAKAAELCERALHLQPKRLNTQLNLARLKIRLAQHDEARPLLEHIRAVAPGFGNSDALWDELKLAS